MNRGLAQHVCHDALAERSGCQDGAEVARSFRSRRLRSIAIGSTPTVLKPDWRSTRSSRYLLPQRSLLPSVQKLDRFHVLSVHLMRVVESRPSVDIPSIAALPWTRSAPDNASRRLFRRMRVPSTSRCNTHKTGTYLRPCYRRTETIQHHSRLGASRSDSVRIPRTSHER